ncbi:MAG: accessory factor UbiK family protein [Burkholderiales bacterium]|jgi:ubiquinone biosynthesis accessory factor UbiK
MLNSKVLDDISARVKEMLDKSPARDVEKNLKALLSSALSRLDLVTREEFEVQTQVLLRTREKLTELEARLDRLESQASNSSGGGG